MKEITVTKKLKVFSRDDIKEAIQYIGEEGYFANTVDEFKDTSALFTLDCLSVSDPNDEDIFECDDGNYSLFAIIEE